MVEKLVLLSPVGLSDKYYDIKSTTIEDWLQKFCFKIEKTPSKLFKNLGGFFSNLIFNSVVTKDKFKGLTDKVRLIELFII